MGTYIQSACDGLNKATSNAGTAIQGRVSSLDTIKQVDDKVAAYEGKGIWPECYNTINGSIWLFVMIYAILQIAVRSFFVRILFWWYKESESVGDKDQEYQSLDGENNQIHGEEQQKDHGTNEML